MYGSKKEAYPVSNMIMKKWTTSLNKYRSMWVLVLFDLPTETKAERKAASKFRKYLLEDGFSMFQYSIYTRFCASRENTKVHMNRVKKQLPKDGHIAIFQITDKQYGMIDLFQGRKEIEREKPTGQLTLF